jgi:hypothetical protein
MTLLAANDRVIAVAYLMSCVGQLANKVEGKTGANSRPAPWQGAALPLSHSRISRNTFERRSIVHDGLRWTITHTLTTGTYPLL